MNETENKGVTRRHFLKVAALSIATLLAADNPPVLNHSRQLSLGATFLPGEISYWGREPIQVLNQLLETGIKTIRLPLYPAQIITSNLDEPKRYAEVIDRKGGKIIWVVGLKQPGWPEIYPPRDLRSRAPEIEEDGLVLDSSPTIVQAELDIVDKSAGFIDTQRQLTVAVQGGNESNYPVELARWRHYSHSFYQEKLSLLKQLTNLPVIATYPDHPSSLEDAKRWLKGLYALRKADYIGLNIYPQKSKHQQSMAEDTGYWALVNLTFNIVRKLGPTPFVAEQQFTPWFDGEKPRPYSVEKSNQDFERSRSLNPYRIDVWGIGPAASPKHPHLWRLLQRFAEIAT